MRNPEEKGTASSPQSSWQISQAAAACGAVCLGPDGPFPLHLTTDSREVEPGWCFVALTGKNTDGHLFIGNAIAGGARVILASREKCPETVPDGVTFLLAEDDTMETLLQLARHYLDRVAPSEVIAITGSVGKTTTREIIAHLLRQHHRLHVASKSYNTDVGCALTVLGMPADTEMLILEMGCNHPGEIAEMVQWFPPTRAVITEVGPSHLEGLSNVEGVLAAKMEITRSERLRTLCYNSDNALLAAAVNNERRTRDFTSIGVGTSDGSELRILESCLESQTGEPPRFRIQAGTTREVYTVRYSLFGLHHARNIALALAVQSTIDGPASRDLVLTLESPPGRGRRFPLQGGGILVDDSYNANPISVTAALNTFATIVDPGKNWIILGGMKELGKDSAAQHRVIASRSEVFRYRIFVGSEWSEIDIARAPGTWLVRDAAEAIEILLKELRPGNSVMVKGSRFYRLETIVDSLVNCRAD